MNHNPYEPALPEGLNCVFNRQHDFVYGSANDQLVSLPRGFEDVYTDPALYDGSSTFVEHNSLEDFSYPEDNILAQVSPQDQALDRSEPRLSPATRQWPGSSHNTAVAQMPFSTSPSSQGFFGSEGSSQSLSCDRCGEQFNTIDRYACVLVLRNII